PIIPKLSAHCWMESATKERDPEKYAILPTHMEKIELEAKVMLGQSNITVNGLLQLSTEDIISLNQKIQDPLTLEVNGEPKMHVQVGTVHKKVAVQVMDHIERRSLS